MPSHYNTNWIDFVVVIIVVVIDFVIYCHCITFINIQTNYVISNNTTDNRNVKRLGMSVRFVVISFNLYPYGARLARLNGDNFVYMWLSFNSMTMFILSFCTEDNGTLKNPSRQNPWDKKNAKKFQKSSKTIYGSEIYIGLKKLASLYTLCTCTLIVIFPRPKNCFRNAKRRPHIPEIISSTFIQPFVEKD